MFEMLDFGPLFAQSTQKCGIRNEKGIIGNHRLKWTERRTSLRNSEEEFRGQVENSLSSTAWRTDWNSWGLSLF